MNKTFVNQETGEQVVAIDNLNFSISENEFVAIIGPSGCGKSTFLYMVAGFEKASSGEILLSGKPITGPGRDRGLVFQEFVLFGWRTVLRNITLGLELQKMPRQDAEGIARRWIRATGLSGFENAYPSTLSGGMKQRVAIARAIAYNPEVLLLDEPFGALDVQTKNYMIKDLHSLWKEADKTILMVTHSVQEAVLMADRVVVFGNRPSGIVHEEIVELPHPREVGDPAVARHMKRVTDALSVEVDKAMLRERGQH
ncbi:MAG: ABC transporter ATP-binding protein [Burkholderiales bacterium]|nr:ABC transporter ATP-binding protein [Burkholderiales bacterium]